MSEFELLFSFLSLLLGLALAQLLSDAARVIELRKSIRVGWLTPLLATLVVIDVSSFWVGFFNFRGMFSANLAVLLVLLLFCGAYYLAVTLVFPSNLDAASDLDEHYWRNRRIVLGTVFIVNFVGACLDTWRGAMSPLGLSFYIIFFVLLIGALLAKRRRASIFWLASLCLFYLALGVTTALLA